MNNCNNCVQKLELLVPDPDSLSGQIKIYYDSVFLLKNSESVKQVTTGDLKTEDFIKYSNESSNFNLFKFN